MGLVEEYEETFEENKDLILKYFSKSQKKAVRDLVLNEGIRLDGRKPDNIRNIWTEIDYLPSTHGSAVFTRGETQALASVTLTIFLPSTLIIHFICASPYKLSIN